MNLICFFRSQGFAFFNNIVLGKQSKSSHGETLCEKRKKLASVYAYFIFGLRAVLFPDYNGSWKNPEVVESL